MVYRPQLLDALGQIEPEAWEGTTWRHMFGGEPPDRENTRGARWNPPGTAAVYLSLERETALAEAEHQVALQPLRPRAKRTLYQLRVTLRSALDLRDRARLEEIGLDEETLRADDPSRCQHVGGAVAWLEHDGLLVPSVRHAGTNLVIYPANRNQEADFERLDHDDIEEPGE